MYLIEYYSLDYTSIRIKFRNLIYHIETTWGYIVFNIFQKYVE